LVGRVSEKDGVGPCVCVRAVSLSATRRRHTHTLGLSNAGRNEDKEPTNEPMTVLGGVAEGGEGERKQAMASLAIP